MRSTESADTVDGGREGREVKTHASKLVELEAESVAVGASAEDLRKRERMKIWSLVCSEACWFEEFRLTLSSHHRPERRRRTTTTTSRQRKDRRMSREL